MIAANKAPVNCANKYGPTLFNLNLLATKKPIVTAGLRCAPEISQSIYHTHYNKSPSYSNANMTYTVWINLIDGHGTTTTENEPKCSNKLSDTFFKHG